MGLFNRKPKTEEPISVTPPPQSRVEIELHKGATAEAAEKAKEVNKHVRDLLEGNGFTIKIALAAGYGAPHNRKKK